MHTHKEFIQEYFPRLIECAGEDLLAMGTCPIRFDWKASLKNFIIGSISRSLKNSMQETLNYNTYLTVSETNLHVLKIRWDKKLCDHLTFPISGLENLEITDGMFFRGVSGGYNIRFSFNGKTYKYEIHNNVVFFVDGAYSTDEEFFKKIPPVVNDLLWHLRGGRD